MPSREVIDAAKALVGTTVRGKWRLDSLLGVGGSAAVFAATHRNGKRGALKILRRDLAHDRQLRDRFLREGYLANLVGHHGTVAMLDDDLDADGTPFLVMELLEGQTLERIVRKEKSLPLREVLRITESVLDVLAAAHVRGIVHGDIKPANVFITDNNEIKLLDFGIASMADATRVGHAQVDALGTPAYMSPEQARGNIIDGRADLYAIGALMFSLITGQRPRKAETAREELELAATQPMPKVRELAPYISQDLADVIDRALAFDVVARWKDAATMQQALRLALLLEQASRPVDEDLMVPPPSEPVSSRKAGKPLPHSLRLLAHAQSESSMPTRRTPLTLPPVKVGVVSTIPPGPSTTHRFSFTSPVGDSDSSATPIETTKPRRRVWRAISLGTVVAAGAVIGIAALNPSYVAAVGLEGLDPRNAATAEPLGASDAGADATMTDASR